VGVDDPDLDRGPVREVPVLISCFGVKRGLGEVEAFHGFAAGFEELSGHPQVVGDSPGQVLAPVRFSVDVVADLGQGLRAGAMVNFMMTSS
jgi:hypothetical protein